MGMNPREKFQKSDLVKGFNDVIDSPQMQAAFDSAMLHFQFNMAIASDMGTAAANEWRRQGAVQFLRILKNLNTNEVAPSKAPDGKLNYGV